MTVEYEEETRSICGCVASLVFLLCWVVVFCEWLFVRWCAWGFGGWGWWWEETRMQGLEALCCVVRSLVATKNGRGWNVNNELSG